MKLVRKIKNKFKFLKKVTIKKIPVYITKEKTSLLEGRIAIVTGATGGIGLAIAKDYLDSGASVILVGRNKNKLDEIISQLKEQYDNVYSYVMDMSDFNNFDEHITNMSQLVNKSIDILVNCAGVVSSKSFPDLTIEEYDKIMDTNLKELVFLSQSFANYMIKIRLKGTS